MESYPSSPADQSVVSTDSLSDFSNNIFGFAATLLIVSITLPTIPPAQVEAQLPSVLAGIWPNIVAYTLSFLNICSYWKLHSFTFMHINLIDNKLVLLTTLLLLSVTFLPFPTALMGKYGRLPLTNFLYGVTLSINYLFLFLTAFYAYKHNLVRPDIPFPARLLLRKKLALPLIAALVGTGLSFSYPRLGFLFYAVVVLTHLIPFKHEEVKS
jgi:uncharacterized membrane protein